MTVTRRLLVPALLIGLIVSSIANAATGPAPPRGTGGTTHCDANGCSSGALNIEYLDVSRKLNVSDLTGAAHHHMNAAGGGKLPNATTVRMAAGLTASGNFSSSFDLADYNTGVSLVSSSSSKNGAWTEYLEGQSGRTVDPSIRVQLPFGVVVGDSIAAGRTELYSRLFPGSATYEPTYPNLAGQLSYDLGEITGYYWFNQGIGGQTTTEILARFPRDVFGEVIDHGDGRGSQTLPGAPHVVFIVAGSNDPTNGMTSAATQANLAQMANVSIEHNITPIFLTVAPRNNYNSTHNAARNETNAWMVATLPTYGAHVVEWPSWIYGSNGYTMASAFTTDGTHPNRGAYTALARHVASSSADVLPYLHGIVMEYPIDPGAWSSSGSRPKEVWFNMTPENASVDSRTTTIKARLPNASDVYVPLRLFGVNHTLNITIEDIYKTGGGTLQHVSISKVRAVLNTAPPLASAGLDRDRLRLAKTASLPICDGDREGDIRYLSGAPGAFYGCRQSATPGTYEWVVLT